MARPAIGETSAASRRGAFAPRSVPQPIRPHRSANARGGAWRASAPASGTATVEIGVESQTLDYKVEGNKLTIVNPKEGDAVFTINEDGTLTGQLGMMTKVKG
ncbi:MAG TPA: hypothetical protein VH475_09805 [Tepidisphaeraceae bacterium]